MLEMLDIGLDHVVAYRLGGKLTDREMASVFSVFREKIERGEGLFVYQEVESFGGVEWEGMLEKMKFFRDFGLSHFRRIAVVTHGKWLHKLVDLEGKLFRDIEMKGFSMEERLEAVRFLERDE